MEQIKIITKCLQDFGDMSGHRVSSEKTHIFFSPNVSQQTRREISRVSGYKQVDELGRYLGADIVHPRRRKEKYRETINRIRQRLQGWKASSLSLAGRMTLVKSTTSSMANYPMQHDRVPSGVIEEIERMQRQFIWGEQGGERKWHAVAWKTLCKHKSNGGIGIKDLKGMNDAFLIKLLWRMKQNPKDLWVKVLRGKYGRGEDNKPEVKVGDSRLWKEMSKLSDIFQNNVESEIKNGASTRVWIDNWIPGEPKLILLAGSNTGIDKNLRVKDLIDEDGRWNLETLENLVPQSVLQHIRDMIPPLREGEEDGIRWKPQGSGGFSTASAYKLVRGGYEEREGHRWKVNWKIKVPERVKVFMWLVLHNRILTRKLIGTWKGEAALCTICHEREEDLLHALRDCPFATATWRQIVPDHLRNNFFKWERKDWLYRNITSRSQKKEEQNWPEMFACSCWHLWKWRNLQVHNANFQPPRDTGEIIRNFLKDCSKNWNGEKMEREQNEPLIVKWSTPQLGWCKINTDGMVMENGQAGCGGAIRGDCGEWLAGFAKKLPPCDSKTAEVWGIFEGLKLCREMGFKKVEVECDAATIIDDLAAGTEISGCYALSRKIAELRTEELSIRWLHTYREGNRCADRLARMSVNVEGRRKIWNCPPRELIGLLREDLEGTGLRRLG